MKFSMNVAVVGTSLLISHRISGRRNEKRKHRQVLRASWTTILCLCLSLPVSTSLFLPFLSLFPNETACEANRIPARVDFRNEEISFHTVPRKFLHRSVQTCGVFFRYSPIKREIQISPLLMLQRLLTHLCGWICVLFVPRLHFSFASCKRDERYKWVNGCALLDNSLRKPCKKLEFGWETNSFAA